MAYTPEEESIVINLITRIDQKYKAQAEKALDDLVKRAENSIASDVTKALNDRIRNRQQAIANELKLEDQRRAKELAGLKADITARSKAESELQQFKFKQAQETNRRILLDSEKTRQAELAGLKADIMARNASTHTKTTDTSGRKIYGDFSDLTSGNTYKADSGTIWKNMQADAGKAGTTSAREYSKTFWGAIEGGTTFGHKLATTFQYATAGTAFYALTAAVGGFTTAIIEADKYSQMFQGVLEMSAGEADKLQKAIYTVGQEIGGTTKGISEAALMLGRAGLENEKLAKGLRVAAMAANVSGDSIENITEMLAAWQTVYPGADIEHLGDMMAKIANESLLSIDGLKTATSYITASGAAAGVTADQLIELAGAWKQTGKADSIVGTEVRRLFAQIESGTDDVRKAYWAMSIDVDKVNKGLKSGVKEEQEATFRAFMAKLGEYRDLPPAQKASIDKLVANLQVLDKQTVQSAIVAGESFSKMETAGANAAGSLEKSSSVIAVSYEKMMERIIATVSEGASRFEQSFSKAISGGATTEDFNRNLESLSTNVNLLFSALGTLTGKALEPFGIAASGLVQTLGLLVKGFDAAYTSLEEIQNGLGSATVALVAFSAIAVKNPFVAVATGAVELLLTLKEILETKEKIDGYNNKTSANKGFLADLNNISTFTTASGKIGAIDKVVEVLNSRIKNAEGGLVNPTGWAALQSNKDKTENSIKAMRERITLLNKLKSDLAKTTTKVDDPKANIGTGGTSYTPKDKDLTAGQIESAAKNLTDEKLRQIELAEQQYFYERDITSDLEQKKYHVGETLKKQKEILEASGFYKNKEEDILKKNIEIWKAKNDIKELEYQSTILSERRLEDINTQLLAIGKQSEEKKIELKYNDQLIALDREREDLLHKKGMLSAEDQDYLLGKLELLQKMTEEERKQLEITRARAVGEYTKTTNRKIEDRKAMTDYDKYSLALSREIADEEQKQYEMSQDKLNYVEMQFAAEERVADLSKQNTYAMYVGMTLQQSLQSELNSSLMDFFDIQSEGWMDFERLGMNVLNNILQQMLQMQVVNPLATTGSSLLSSGISALFSGFSGGAVPMDSSGSWDMGMSFANGGVFSNGIKAYAKGSTFTNSIVKKPTYFASGGTMGVMGESGPELVAPLKRDSQGRMGVIVTGSEGGSKNITINIKNESGEQLSVTKSEASTDMSGMVLDIVIDAISRNKKGMRDVIRGGR